MQKNKGNQYDNTVKRYELMQKHIPIISGATTNSMKPICILQRLMFVRSHMGEMSMPSSLSLSPYRHSSNIQGFDEADIQKKPPILHYLLTELLDY